MRTPLWLLLLMMFPVFWLFASKAFLVAMDYWGRGVHLGQEYFVVGLPAAVIFFAPIMDVFLRLGVSTAMPRLVGWLIEAAFLLPTGILGLVLLLRGALIWRLRLPAVRFKDDSLCQSMVYLYIYEQCIWIWFAPAIALPIN